MGIIQTDGFPKPVQRLISGWMYKNHLGTYYKTSDPVILNQQIWDGAQKSELFKGTQLTLACDQVTGDKNLQAWP